MAIFYGAVYDPPLGNLPYVAVVFNPDGSVFSARAVSSVDEGENLIAMTLAQIKETGDKG